MRWIFQFECKSGDSRPGYPMPYSIALVENSVNLLDVIVAGDSGIGNPPGTRATLTVDEVTAIHGALGAWLSRLP
jgi:hypothetical protein